LKRQRDFLASSSAPPPSAVANNLRKPFNFRFELHNQLEKSLGLPTGDTYAKSLTIILDQLSKRVDTFLHSDRFSSKRLLLDDLRQFAPTESHVEENKRFTICR
jgi:hypothetical protein